MAQAAGLLDQDRFRCGFCLNLLNDPVAIPCGHNFCIGCITGLWDLADSGVYSCPQCSETFDPRPILRKNTMLAEVVEKLKKTELQAAPPARCHAGPGDVECEVCAGRKRKAVKSCLVCLVSYCEDHVKLHNELNPGRKHKLINASGSLQERICARHDKLLEIYCRTDQKCICYLCTIEDHRGHDTVSLATEGAEKQKQLGATQSKFQQRIQEREKELQDLRQAMLSLKHSAKTSVEDSERIFTELISSLERRSTEVKALIRDQEKAAVSRAEGLLERLEQEIAELRRRDAELEQLSHSDDPIHLLQNSKSLFDPPGPGDLPSITSNPRFSFEAVKKCVSELKERVEDVCKEEITMVSMMGRAVGMYGCFVETGEPAGSGTGAPGEEACSLCLGPLQEKLRLTCSHPFCAACLERSVERLGLHCPVCLKELTVVGDQPKGEMTWGRWSAFLVICYDFSSGIQSEAHPNPGKPFPAIRMKAYLPDTKEGKEILKLLQRAFAQKLVCTVATTEGAEDEIIFADIPHSEDWYKCKTPEFLKELKAVLRAKFIW